MDAIPDRVGRTSASLCDGAPAEKYAIRDRVYKGACAPRKKKVPRRFRGEGPSSIQAASPHTSCEMFTSFDSFTKIMPITKVIAAIATGYHSPA